MKKALSAVLAVVLVLGVCFSVPMIASATDADKFTYELNDAQNPTGYIITGVKDGVTGEVEIPATYKPTGNINIFYPNNSEEPNVGSYEVTTTVSPSAEAGTATVAADEEDATKAVVTITPEEGYTLKSITVGGTPVAELPTAVEGVYTYTFTPEADVTVAVVFEEETPVAPTEYNVTLTQPEVGGTISASAEKGVSGATVTLTATPADEYAFVKWTVTGEGASVAENVLTIGTADVTVTAEFAKKTYAISHDETIAAYVGGEVVTVAAKDAEVVIKPVDETKIIKTVTAKTGEEEADKLTVTNNKFTMPGKAVTVEAELVQGYAVNVAATENGTVTVNKTLAAKDDVITVSTTPTTGYKLDTLKVAYTGAEGEETVTAEADGSYKMPEAAVTVTATFVKEEYTITLPENVINGTIAIEVAKTTYHYGDTIELTVTPAAGCQLATLTYTYEGLETPVAIENDTFSMPAKNITINVTFAAKELPIVGIADGAFDDATGVTAFTVAEGQDLFVAENGVLFEKVAGTEGAPDTLKLIAFPAAYVATNEAKTYTIPATVDTLAVTAVADGAFQALGNVQYVFCADAEINIEESAQPAFGSMSDDETPVFVSNKKFHTTTGHTEDDGEITTPATCQVDGVKTFKCEDCEAVLRTESVHDANAHRFLTENDGWVVETPATCIYDGIQRRYCQNQGCNYVETETIAATKQHVAGEGTVTTEATCTADGVMTFYCTGCKTAVVKTEVIEKLGHKISDPDVVVKATCDKDGYVEGICDNCNTKQRIDEAKKGHKMITVVDAKATCTVAGSQHEECEYCGYMDEDAVIGTIPALGHSKAEDVAWTIVKEATCAEAGLLQKFCDTCRAPLTDKDGKEITRVLEATGEHEYKDYTVTKAPTCTEKGAETGTCACGATDVREVKALGHEFATEFTEDEPATCTKAGSKSKHCTRTGCQEKSEVTVIPVIAHTADDTWKTVEGKAATCYAEGEKTGTCAVCKTENCVLPIEKLAHTWAETAVAVKEPIEVEVQKVDEEGKPVVDEDGEPVMETITYAAATCEEAGYTVKYCTVEGCGAHDATTLTKVDKLGHDFDETHDAEKPSNVQPSCDEVGYKFVWCKTCSEANKTNDNKGYVKVEVAATGHKWATEAEALKEEIEIEIDGKTVTAKAPTCEEDGYTAVYCDTCGDYKDVTAVKALGHKAKFADWTKDETPATCQTKAFETNECSRCGEVMKQDVGDFAAHNFSKDITRTYPTCEEDGIEYYACTVDGCKARDQEKVLPALGHVHADDAEFVGTDATCEKAGEKIKACTRLFNADGSLYEAPKTEEPTTPDEGDDEGTEGDSTTPTTVAEGDANDGGETPTIPEGVVACEGLKQVTKATGHAFSDDYTVDTQPTCTEKGVKSRHCTNKGCTAKTGTVDVKALGHEFGETYTVDTKATCSSVGYESIHCTRYADCETKKTGSTREIPTTDHTYLDTAWKTIKAPTCEEKGIQENYCTVCCDENSTPESIGYTTRETAARGHSWAMDYVTVEATCTTDGETYLPCERSGCKGKSEVTVLPKTGHNWATAEEEKAIETAKPADAEEKETPVTCTTDGFAYKWCKTCEAWVGVELKAEGHKYSTTPITVEPTCYKEGSLTGECSVCKAKDAVQVLPKLDHTWGDWELVEDATDCTAEDSMIRACTVKECNATELGENKEHTVSSWIIGTKATCGTAGEMHTECKVCAKVIETEAIAATGKHDLKETITTAPTCIDAGEKTVECQAEDCNYSATVVIPANGHSYTEWKVFVEPTCTTKGIRQSVCEVCLTTQSEKILALGHDLGDYITDTPAACGKVGSKHKECSRCDYKTDAETIAALEHNFVGNDCANKCGAKIYEYALVEGSTTDIIITKYNGSDVNLVIPAEIDGYKVVAIGDRAFMKTVIVPGTPATETEEATEDTITYVESDFTSLTIPASIAKIGDYAFGNSKLTLVNIPATVTTIGKCAFGYDVVITMVEGEGDNAESVENIEATQVEGFTIYGVKDSAAETYAKQDATKDDDDFAFVEVKNVYDVVIDEEETNIVEVADGIIFKEFEPVNKDDDSTKIVNQIKAVIELPEGSTYKVAVEPSQSYDVIEKDEQGNETVKETLSFYGTGTKVLVKDATGNVVDEIVIIVEGDVNGDGAIDAIDCMLIQLAAKDAKVLEGVYYTAGNITPDTAIDANDFSAAVDKIFGEDLVVEEPTTEPTTQAPSTTEPTTQAPAESTTQAPAESTTQAPATTTTTVAPSEAA